ncbi:hypothetical protein HDU84_004414 [Entophlyctis sp. JEL0112]|nr:hypothetical protein HDU84_004414 [Entophlyctis sp. JEL0112]
MTRAVQSAVHHAPSLAQHDKNNHAKEGAASKILQPVAKAQTREVLGEDFSRKLNLSTAGRTPPVPHNAKQGKITVTNAFKQNINKPTTQQFQRQVQLSDWCDDSESLPELNKPQPTSDELKLMATLFGSPADSSNAIVPAKQKPQTNHSSAQNEVRGRPVFAASQTYPAKAHQEGLTPRNTWAYQRRKNRQARRAARERKAIRGRRAAARR